jgi:hypothetical protein
MAGLGMKVGGKVKASCSCLKDVESIHRKGSRLAMAPRVRTP